MVWKHMHLLNKTCFSAEHTCILKGIVCFNDTIKESAFFESDAVVLKQLGILHENNAFLK